MARSRAEKRLIHEIHPPTLTPHTPFLMHLLDWLVLLIPALAVVYIAWRTQSYNKGVAGFLAGGRVAGRYVVAVASGEAAFGLISAVAIFEQYYKSGYAIAFWQKLATPIGLILTLTGFLIYRYRETRVMTMAQFFEVRYSKRFRIFAGGLSFVAGLINYALFPAVGARFIIYYTGMPLEVSLLGFTVATFPLVMIFFLGISLAITLLGGQLTVMVTDCVQGIFSYIGYAIIFVAIFWFFSFKEFGEAMLARGPGLSFINPFDTAKLQDFNLLFIIIGLIASIYNRMSWQGTQGYNAAALNAHEQKMAGVLGTWKTGFQGLMLMLLALAAYTYMHHPDFTQQAAAVQTELTQRIQTDSVATTQTLQKQMLVPVAIREFLPVGVMGVFLALMIFAMVSTDTTYMHSWGSILVQDVILPLRKKPFSQKAQLLLLRLAITGVAVFAFFFSLFYGQTTYILMFFALTGALYLGGAGAVIIGGMYWSRGTSAGAWAAMLVGLFFAIFGFFCTQYWADMIYPWLAANHPAFLDGMRHTLASLSSTLRIANWEVGPTKFPITGQEVLLITMVSASSSYILISLLTCREKFNLDRMLHRGQYKIEEPGAAPTAAAATQKTGILQKLLGFNSEYSRGDRWLAWSVFWWTMFHFAIFLIVAGWNLIFGVWSDSTWFLYWKYYTIGLTAVVAVISTVWFTVGGTLDLRNLFRRLKTLEVNAHDDGRVVGHMNADEYAAAQLAKESKPSLPDERAENPQTKP
jgi:SSS family solute:Na+ symporter